jgi:hypothetical protein
MRLFASQVSMIALPTWTLQLSISLIEAHFLRYALMVDGSVRVVDTVTVVGIPSLFLLDFFGGPAM